MKISLLFKYLYLLAGAAITKNHSLGGLNNKNMFSQNSGS